MSLTSRTERLLSRQATDPALGARVTALRQEYRRIRAGLAARADDAPRSVRVVATTVDRAVSDPAVYERRYDNVLVERAGQVPAAYLLWAAGLAERALTLASDPGDPDERPPEPAVAVGDVSPEQRRWLSRSLLERLGLDIIDTVDTIDMVDTAGRDPDGILLV